MWAQVCSFLVFRFSQPPTQESARSWKARITRMLSLRTFQGEKMWKQAHLLLCELIPLRWTAAPAALLHLLYPSASHRIKIRRQIIPREGSRSRNRNRNRTRSGGGGGREDGVWQGGRRETERKYMTITAKYMVPTAG